MKKSEIHKLAVKKREWDKVSGEINPSWTRYWKDIRKLIRTEKDKMMYGKRLKDKVDRFAYESVWWFKLLMIYFAFSYIFGR